MFKNVLVPKSCYFGTMVQLVQESPTLRPLGIECINSKSNTRQSRSV